MARARLPLMVFVCLLLIWQAVVVIFKVPDYLFPSPYQIAMLIPSRLQNLLDASEVTALEALGGFVLSAVAGVALSLFFALSGSVRRSFYPYIVTLQTIPIIAISPLILLWFGNSSISVMFISFLISFPAIVVNTTQGLISVDKNLLNLFQMGDATLPSTMLKLRLPHALPNLFAGLRIASGASVVGALVGETFAGSSSIGQGGLGYSAIYALTQLSTPYLFTLIMASSLLGLLFFFAVTLAERLVLGNWHESVRSEMTE